MAPTFILTLNRPQGGACSNWTLASSDPEPDLFPINSVQPISVAAAQRWGADMIARNTSYTFVRWIEDEAGQVWTAELKRIRHDFRIAFTDGETCKVRAKNAANAEEIRDAISGGATFIEFINDAEDALFVNLAHVFAITYQPVEMDL